jgi:hypothetical protein
LSCRPMDPRLDRVTWIHNRLWYQLKNRKGDQRGGSEWEPIKILLQRENSAYTPIATRFARTHKSGSKLGTHKPTRPRDRPRIKLEGLEAEASHKRWSVEG